MVENFEICFNSTDMKNNVKFKKIFENPIIIPEDKDYIIQAADGKLLDCFETPFEAEVYINGYIKVVCINGDAPGSLYCFSSRNKLTKIIKEIKILFDWNPFDWNPFYTGYEQELVSFENFKLEFEFVEKPTIWIENDTKEECCICYEETALTTRCEPVRHYVCKECFSKIKNKCPYCARELF